MVEHRHRLARLCEQLADIRVVVDRAGQLAVLEAILTELRAGADTAELTSGADELLRRCGVARGLGDRRSPGGGRLPYLGGGHPVEEARVCPLDRCDRVALDGGGTCRLYGEPLRPVRL
ncbi:hypothetical protein [Streptomyces sp. NPDC006463]|uniref:hypothetical protein n=1 Tax=Streptomyces sp. NPDC006463 TaxID=3364746 RepID=UPI00368E4006